MKYKEGDKVIIARYRFANQIGAVYEVAKYTENDPYIRDGLVVFKGYPCWFMDEDHLLPDTKENTEQLRLADKNKIAEEFAREYLDLDKKEIQAVVEEFGSDNETMGAEIVRLRRQIVDSSRTTP